MNPIEGADRRVVNRFDPAAPWVSSPGGGEEFLQLDRDLQLGVGFHLYRMAPGTSTTPHEHTAREHFLVLEGDLVDHDGHTYVPGDVVMLERGTRHNSRTSQGCVLAVFIETMEQELA